jgi:WD40 repeat protein
MENVMSPEGACNREGIEATDRPRVGMTTDSVDSAALPDLGSVAPVLDQQAAGAPNLPPSTYDVFISYRRKDATPLAQWIRRQILNYRLPPEILKSLPEQNRQMHERRPQVWLDTAYERASDDFLIRNVFPALDLSKRLIVVATPSVQQPITSDGVVRDNWVVREIDYYLGGARVDEEWRPIDVVLGPGAQEGMYPGRLAERKRWNWIDCREFGRWRSRLAGEPLDDALTKLIASLYQVPGELIPVLRQEERRRRTRRLTLLAATGLVISAFMTGLAIWGWMQRSAAITALDDVLRARAKISVQLANEQLSRKDPDGALASALAGVQTVTGTNTQTVADDGLITAIGNSVARQTFGSVLRGPSDAVLHALVDPKGQAAVTVDAGGNLIRWERASSSPWHQVGPIDTGYDTFALAENAGVVVGAKSDGHIKIWRLADDPSEPDPSSFGQTLSLLTVSDDGHRIVALAESGELAIWQGPGKQWEAFGSIKDGALSVRLSPQGDYLVVQTKTGELQVWHFGSSDPAQVMTITSQAQLYEVSCCGTVVFSAPDGTLWVASEQAWSAPTRFGEVPARASRLALSQDGGFVAVTSNDGTTIVWDLHRRSIASRIRSSGATVASSAFAPDGRTIALGYGDGQVTLWRVGEEGSDAAEMLVLRGHTAAVLDLSFSKDATLLASSASDATVRMWRLQNAERPSVHRAGTTASVGGISRNGAYLIRGSTDGRLAVHRSGPVWEEKASTSMAERPSAISILSSGTRAFVGSMGGQVLVWDIEGSVILPLTQGLGSLSSLTLSPDERLIAAIGVNGRLEICKTDRPPTQCQSVDDLRAKDIRSWGYSTAFSEDGKRLGAAAGVERESGYGLVRELVTGRTLLLTGHTDRIGSIVFSRSGNLVLTAAWDGTARLWDTSTGREIARFVDVKGRMSTAGFSQDDRWIATSLNDKVLRLWKIPEQLDSAQPVVVQASESIVLSENTQIGTMRFMPNAMVLAATSSTGEVRLWHLPDGKLRAVFQGSESPLVQIAFAKDSLTGLGTNGNILTWGLPPIIAQEENTFLVLAKALKPRSWDSAPAAQESDQTRCPIKSVPNLGLPPHAISGKVRARQRVTLPASCLAPGAREQFVEAAIASNLGDYVTAREIFEKSRTVSGTAEIGLGDLAFVNSVDHQNLTAAKAHYSRARELGTTQAASRLGWLLMSGDQTSQSVSKAKGYFAEGAALGDADGYAGLAWSYEHFGTSIDDVRSAVTNYTIAQGLYEKASDIRNATAAAEQRASLARLLSPTDAVMAFRCGVGDGPC